MIRIKKKIVTNNVDDEITINYFVENDSHSLYNVIFSAERNFPDWLDIYVTVDCFSRTVFSVDIDETMICWNDDCVFNERSMEDDYYARKVFKNNLAFINEHFVELLKLMVEKWML